MDGADRIFPLDVPRQPALAANIRSAAARRLPLVQKDRHKGETAIVAGSGPSLMVPDNLRQMRELIQQHRATILACGEAVRLLREAGFKVRYSVSMDPNPDLTERTHRDRTVTYCLASSCDPGLYDHVLNAGCRVEIFHSACAAYEGRYRPGFVSRDGTKQLPGKWALPTLVDGVLRDDIRFCPVVPEVVMNEAGIYVDAFGPDQWIAGGGLNVVTRAAALAEQMGFAEIYLAGADFGYREGSDYYATGAKMPSNPGWDFCDGGLVDGIPWHTRIDLLYSAVDVAPRVRDGRLKIIGDSLAKSLAQHDDAFLRRACEWIDDDM